MSSGPELQDYVFFFESEPEWIHENGWFYGTRFVFRQHNDELIVTLAPDEAEIDLLLHRSGSSLLKLRLKMVVEWKIDRNKDSEYLLMRVNTGPAAFCGFEYCILRLRPSIEIDC